MKMNNKGQDCFQTPPSVFKQLNDVFNFTIDAACETTNALCERGFYYDMGVNGLEESWRGERVFCNPPFSTKSAWLKKAFEEVENGGCPLVVMILQTLCESTDAFQDYAFRRYWNTVKTMRQRIAFIDPTTGQPATGNNSGTTIVIFMKEVVTNTKRKGATS